MREPSGRQIEFAKLISYYLNIELPEEYSAQAYWEYINKNSSRMYEIIESRREEAYNRIMDSRAKDVRRRESIWASGHLYPDTYVKLVKEGVYDWW